MEFTSILRSLLALTVVMAVLAGLAFVLRSLRVRRLLAGPGGRFLGVLESAALSQDAALHLVRVGERYFVITAGSGRPAALCEVPRSSLETWRSAGTRAKAAPVERT